MIEPEEIKEIEEMETREETKTKQGDFNHEPSTKKRKFSEIADGSELTSSLNKPIWQTSLWLNGLPSEIWEMFFAFIGKNDTKSFGALRLTCRALRFHINLTKKFWTQIVPHWKLEMYVHNCRRFNWPITDLVIPPKCQSPEVLGLLPSELESLSFTDSQIGLAGILSLPQSLTKLDLSSSPLLELNEWRKLPSNLSTLSLRACQGLTDDAIRFLPRSLTVLDISGNLTRITSECLMFLPRCLKEFSAKSCDISGDLLHFLPSDLVKLELAGCKNLGTGIHRMPRSLRYLDIESCNNFRFLDNLPPYLTYLNVKNCSKLTDAIAKHLPASLTSLNLACCSQLTNNIITQLPSSLTYLNLYGCPNITPGALKQLPASIQKLGITSRYKMILSPLAWAALLSSEFDYQDLIRHFLSSGQNVYTYCPLYYAVKKGAMYAISMLLEHGANPDQLYSITHGQDAYNGFTATPFFLACDIGRTDVINLFISWGSDVNVPRSDGCSPLWMAVHGNREEIVRILVEHGANVEQALPKRDTTPFFMACEKGMTSIAEYLLSQGADPNAKAMVGLSPDEQITPFFVAAQNGLKAKIFVPFANIFLIKKKGCVEIVEMLLSKGLADPNFVCATDGTTPIFMACQNKHKEVVAVMLKYNVNLNVPTLFDTVTPLYTARFGL